MIRVLAYPVVNHVVQLDSPSYLCKETVDYQHALSVYDRAVTQSHDGPWYVVLERDGRTHHSTLVERIGDE